MISGIKQHSTVGKNGKIEISSTDLPEGTVVEVIVLVESQAIDETDYLLSTPANRDHLIQTLESVKDSDNLIVITPNEWNEKYRRRIQYPHKGQGDAIALFVAPIQSGILKQPCLAQILCLT